MKIFIVCIMLSFAPLANVWAVPATESSQPPPLPDPDKPKDLCSPYPECTLKYQTVLEPLAQTRRSFCYHHPDLCTTKKIVET